MRQFRSARGGGVVVSVEPVELLSVVLLLELFGIELLGIELFDVFEEPALLSVVLLLVEPGLVVLVEVLGLVEVAVLPFELELPVDWP